MPLQKTTVHFLLQLPMVLLLGYQNKKSDLHFLQKVFKCYKVEILFS